MSEPKFTEGEWMVGTSKNVGDILVYSKRQNYEQLVAQVVCQAEDTAPNAALISAAPDLYRALEEAIDLIGFWHGKAAWGIYREQSPEKRISDALNKARGEPA